MRSNTYRLSFLFLASIYCVLGAGQVAPAANLITNPGFEKTAAGLAEGWRPFDRGYSVDESVRHTGARSIRCVNGSSKDASGASWTVELNQKEPAPLLVAGWSRAEGVEGVPDSEYSIYVDLVYTDGTPLWGQIASFDVGSHDWQKRKVLIAPAKPLRSATIHALFRHHSGTVWFDDFSAVELKGGRFFDSQAIAAPHLPAGVSGGWFARDVAADSPLRPLANGVTDAALGLHATVRTGKPAEVREAEIADTTGRARAITVYYVERFAGKPDQAVWWNDIRHSVPAGRSGERTNLTRIGCGATGSMSLYPFGCVTDGTVGRAVGIPPLLGPRISRIGYNAAAGLLYIAFDVALIPNNRANSDGHGHGTATLAVASYTIDPQWGFRSAADKYYHLFRDAFDRRAKAEGIWIPFSDPSKVDHVEDFGIAYHEGDNSIASDDRLGILSFRYTEPMTWWMSMPAGMERKYDVALEMAKRLADGKGEASLKPWAQALLHSGAQDPNGRFHVQFLDTPWANGALWVLNPNPHLPAGPDARTKASISYTPAIADRLYDPRSAAVQDGEYLDSIEGWAEFPDYRPESLEWSSAPPTFATDDFRPLVPTFSSVWEFAKMMHDDLHHRGKLLMANSTPWRIHAFAPILDVMGTETNWLPGGKWQPDSDAVFNLRRTLCYHKPYLLLQNTDFDQFGTERVEKYFQRSLFYGCYPSMFSIDASTHPYWQEPRWYNRDRALFKRYIPLIKQLSAAGWEPVTHARSSNPAVYVERYGSTFLTLMNDSQAAADAVIQVDLGALGIGASPRVTDLIGGEPQPVTINRGSASVRVSLRPEQVMLLQVANKK